MAIKANLGTQNLSVKVESVEHPSHPCVVIPMKVKQNQGVLKKGLIVGKDANGEIVPYDPNAKDANGNPLPESKPVGILTDDVNTDTDSVAMVIVHGTVFRERVFRADGNALTDTDIQNLSQLTIWLL